MGGKSKQSQRTKNNVRPSSSSRSAEVLNSAMSSEGGLLTMTSGKSLPALFPTLNAVNLEQNLNPEYQMCIKKLSKKDPITRAKGLQELCDLVNNGSIEDAEAALPVWAHHYKILTADTDRKVREMTQVCHGALVRLCGRRAAPQLKALLPAWLQAQYDEHAPAQTHAAASLTTTFPDTKLPEVISFCKAEVMAHLLENLIGNTEAIISKKIEDAEERELVVRRVVTSSLRGLEWFVARLPAPHHAWLWEQLAPLLDAAAFWKFASHAAPQVRAAWYGATGSIVERHKGQFAALHGQRTLRVLLNAARESNALVAAQIWTCLLQFMHNVEDWSQYLDKKELLVKRILDVLETGGWGDARHLSSMLLPLLAHVPRDVLTKQFYEAFFNAVYSGFDKKNIISSKSERQSWITSLSECLRYLSIQDDDFVVEVATAAHRTWLERALAGTNEPQTRNNLVKYSATSMTALVKYWLKRSKEDNGEKYDQLLRNFWQNIGSTVSTEIDKCSTDIAELERLVDGHILLLQTLKTTFLHETKKRQSIKFEKLNDEEQKPAEKTPVTPEQCDTSTIERYTHNLHELVHGITAHYFEVAAKKQVPYPILGPMITLLKEFDSAGIYEAIARQFNTDSTYKLYESVLRTWLTDDTMRCHSVLDTVFLMLKYMTEEEQDAVFESFKQFPSSVVSWCLSLSVSHPYVLLDAARRWTRGALAADAATALARRAVQHADRAAAALLLQCLADAPPPDTEMLISVAGVSGVVAAVSAGIERATAGEQDADSEALCPALAWGAQLGARLVTALAASPYVAAAPGAFAALVQRLFYLTLVVPRGCGLVAADTWCEALSSWQDGLSALPPPARTAFLDHAARLLKERLFHKIEEVDINKIEHMVSLVPYLFAAAGAPPPTDVAEVIAFTNKALDLGDEERLAVEICALRHDCITLQLDCLYADSDATRAILKDSSRQDIKEVSGDELARYINKFLYRAVYVRTLLAAGGEDESSEWSAALLREEGVARPWCELLHDHMVLVALAEGYTYWQHHHVVEAAEAKMCAVVPAVVACTAGAVRRELLAALGEIAAQGGYYWARAHRYYLRQALPAHELDAGDELEVRDVSGNGYFHMLQAHNKLGDNAELSYQAAYIVMLRAWHAAHRDVSAALLHDLERCQQTHDVDVVVNAYYRDNRTMLYDVDVLACEWKHVVSNATVAHFLALLVEQRGWDEPAHHWDFATISLSSMLNSLVKSQANWGCTKVAMLTLAVLRLYGAVREFCTKLPGEAERRQPSPHVANLMAEWRDIFAPDTTASLYELAAHVLASSESSVITLPQAAVLSALIDAIQPLDWYSVPEARRTGAGALGLRALADGACAALLRPTHPAFKWLSYTLLMNLAPAHVLHDAQTLKEWSGEEAAEGAGVAPGEAEEERERPALALDHFRDTFAQLQDLVDATLSNVELGEAVCELACPSDGHSLALGWLLLGEARARVCELARGDLAHFYIQICRESKWVPALLAAALRLLPGELFAYAHDPADGAAPPPRHFELFLAVAPFSMRAACQGASLSALACRALYTCVCGGAAGAGAARSWWAAAPPRTARALERLVTAYVAPHAVRAQLTQLQRRAHEVPDSEVHIIWSTSEVVCAHRVEESTVELRVWLARAHPLTPPRLSTPALSGPATTHWLALYLAYHSGSLLNALKMWTRAVNARVERAPQCYICYCRLHPASGLLPRVPCHQCRNRFHNMCLRKWFSTSNRSNCPLCRANF